MNFDIRAKHLEEHLESSPNLKIVLVLVNYKK